MVLVGLLSGSKLRDKTLVFFGLVMHVKEYWIELYMRGNTQEENIGVNQVCILDNGANIFVQEKYTKSPKKEMGQDRECVSEKSDKEIQKRDRSQHRRRHTTTWTQNKDMPRQRHRNKSGGTEPEGKPMMR